MNLQIPETEPLVATDDGRGTMSAAMVGILVVGVSLATATLFCTALCLALWCRRLRGHAGDPSPATFLVSKRKPDPYAAPDHPMAFVMPTITHSEAGSEPRTPTPTLTLTPTERSKNLWRSTAAPTPTTRTPSQDSFSHLPNRDGLPAVDTTISPSNGSAGLSCSATTYTPQGTTSTQRPRSASPRGLLRSSSRKLPLSLPLGTSRWSVWPQAASQHHSASPKNQLQSPGTPPLLLPRSIYTRKGAVVLDELRAALHTSFATSDLTCTLNSPDSTGVATPDSVDGWGPVWTPASSIGSGGGCGLGEVRLRLSYSLRAHQLRLTIISADQLPLRLGPEPVDTYAKAVLLPEKRIKFTSRTVPATDNAVFNVTFAYDAWPSRLAHTTLRISVCQVTECGRRVVVGYAAVGLAASMGLRLGLAHDLDTGPLSLHLQETAPDQQVGMGGQLQVGLRRDSDASDLTIRICSLTGLQLLPQTPLQDTAQVYVKVTVYINNTILCWRRTSPRALKGDVTVFEEDLVLHMPELDLDATHLVLSARLRLRPGCGRRVVGSCLVGCGGCVGEEGRFHWHDMLRASPDLVVRTHPLAAHADYHRVVSDQDSPPLAETTPRDQMGLPYPKHAQYRHDPTLYLPPATQVFNFNTSTIQYMKYTSPTTPAATYTTASSLSATQTTPTSPSTEYSTATSSFTDPSTPASPFTDHSTATSPIHEQCTPGHARATSPFSDPTCGHQPTYQS
ncbi:uncharacterized protein [Panulirus ornatus]|uniref:uncharacterized protein n=1 Tax=Panulirus ornatus TaxID=150431 RepID=UPI003A88A0DC